MSSVRQVAVFTENKLGQLARITGLLAAAGINIRLVTISSSENFGIVKVLVDKADAAAEQLKAHGLTVSLVEATAIEVPDQPGALNGVAEVLTRGGINIDNASGFVTKSHQKAVLVIETHDASLAQKLLSKHGYTLLSSEQMLNL